MNNQNTTIASIIVNNILNQTTVIVNCHECGSEIFRSNSNRLLIFYYVTHMYNIT